MYGLLGNPNSKKNKTDPLRISKLENLLGPRGMVIKTGNVDEIPAALEAMNRSGIQIYMSDGGDGSFHHLVNGLRDLAPDNSGIPLCLSTNGGTVNGIMNWAGIQGDAFQILERLPSGEVAKKIEIPSILLEGEHRDGKKLERICFSAILGGLGINFFEKYYARADPGIPGAIKIAGQAMGSLVLHLPVLSKWTENLAGHKYLAELFKPVRARVRLDGLELPLEEYQLLNAGALNFNIANLFRPFPLARQGKLHFQVGRVSLPGLALNLGNLMMGREFSGAGLYDQAGELLEVESAEPDGLSLLLDGEFYLNLEKFRLSPGPVIRSPWLNV